MAHGFFREVDGGGVVVRAKDCGIMGRGWFGLNSWSDASCWRRILFGLSTLRAR